MICCPWKAGCASAGTAAIVSQATAASADSLALIAGDKTNQTILWPSVHGSAWLAVRRVVEHACFRLFERQGLLCGCLLDEQRGFDAERFGHVFDFREIAQIVQAESN